MASSENRPPDDLLTRYLLGALTEKEAERLDELSISDEEFAWRLEAIENDLVDAYVRGELPEGKAKQFKTFYLSSPARRQKVQFAQGLLGLERKAAAPAKVESHGATATGPTPQSAPRQSPWRLFAGPRFAFHWGLTAAALAFLVFGGYLLVQNVQLRRQLTEADAQHAFLTQRTEELQKQLNHEKAVQDSTQKKDAAQKTDGTQKEPENTLPLHPNLDRLKTISVLLPPTRGASQLPAVSLQRGTDLVVLVLALETNDFPSYRAKLRDPVSNRTLWLSSRLNPVSAPNGTAVSVSIDATMLKQQNYIVDLLGTPSHGSAEVIGGYPFRVVLH